MILATLFNVLLGVRLHQHTKFDKNPSYAAYIRTASSIIKTKRYLAITELHTLYYIHVL